MPLPINIEDLIRQRKVERTRIEYKADWNPEPIIHTITAFANDFDNMGGGYILIGVEEENGRPILPVKGLESADIDKIQLDILNKCNLIEPRFIPMIEPYSLSGMLRLSGDAGNNPSNNSLSTAEKEIIIEKEILVLWVPGGEERPYKCPDKIYTAQKYAQKYAQKDLKSLKDSKSSKSPKSYYIRKGARTLKANAFEERELISMARDIPFDDRVNYNAEVEAFKPALLADYLHSVGSSMYEKVLDRSVEEVGTDMKIVRGPLEYRKPVNVGLMFFSDDPENYFSCARIEVVDKPDPTGVGMTEKIFRGPLDRQLRDALAYIKNYIIKEYVTKVPDSELAVRAFNWPYQAVDEALSNAVYHKSYQLHEPITVTVTPEKMEILSLPGPDWSITKENLENRVLVSRRYRNRRIGEFLKELEIVEGRNTGVPLIIQAMKNNGSDLPVFETDNERSYFVTILPIHPFFKEQGQKPLSLLSHANTAGSTHGTHGTHGTHSMYGTHDGTNSTANHGNRNNAVETRRNRQEIKKLLISLLKRKGNLSTNEAAGILGYKKLTDTLRAVVGELIEAGQVSYLFPDKPRSRNQKICLVK